MRHFKPSSAKPWTKGRACEYSPGDGRVLRRRLAAAPYKFIGVWMVEVEGVAGRVPADKVRLKRGPQRSDEIHLVSADGG